MENNEQKSPVLFAKYTEETISSIDSTYQDCNNMAQCANTKAIAFKALSFLLTITSLVFGALIGVVSSNGIPSENSNSVLVAVLGFYIAVSNGFNVGFSPEAKAVQMKEISNRLFKIARNVRRLKLSNLDETDIHIKLEFYHGQIDEMDLTMFIDLITNKKGESSPGRIYRQRGEEKSPVPATITRNLWPVSAIDTPNNLNRDLRISIPENADKSLYDIKFLTPPIEQRRKNTNSPTLVESSAKVEEYPEIIIDTPEGKRFTPDSLREIRDDRSTIMSPIPGLSLPSGLILPNGLNISDMKKLIDKFRSGLQEEQPIEHTESSNTMNDSFYRIGEVRIHNDD